MIDAETLSRARAGSLLQLVFRLARLADEEAVRRIAAQGGLRAQLRTAHTRLFPHIALEGTRPTEIARALGVSKQAIGQLVDDLVDMGVVERIPDPADGRAVRVRWTALGRAGMLEGLAMLGTLEAELGAVLGADALAMLHTLVTQAVAEAERWAP